MVKLGLYDPGFEEEIAFYTFDEIYSWGASDLQVLAPPRHHNHHVPPLAHALLPPPVLLLLLPCCCC